MIQWNYSESTVKKIYSEWYNETSDMQPASYCKNMYAGSYVCICMGDG